jgi:hypothetical protein
MDEQDYLKEPCFMRWEELRAAVEAEAKKSKPPNPMFVQSAEGSYDMCVANIRNGKELFLRYDPEVRRIYIKREGADRTLTFREPKYEACEILDGGIPTTVEALSVTLIRGIW